MRFGLAIALLLLMPAATARDCTEYDFPAECGDGEARVCLFSGGDVQSIQLMPQEPGLLGGWVDKDDESAFFEVMCVGSACSTSYWYGANAVAVKDEVSCLPALAQPVLDGFETMRSFWHDACMLDAGCEYQADQICDALGMEYERHRYRRSYSCQTFIAPWECAECEIECGGSQYLPNLVMQLCD